MRRTNYFLVGRGVRLVSGPFPRPEAASHCSRYLCSVWPSGHAGAPSKHSFQALVQPGLPITYLSYVICINIAL